MCGQAREHSTCTFSHNTAVSCHSYKADDQELTSDWLPENKTADSVQPRIRMLVFRPYERVGSGDETREHVAVATAVLLRVS